MPVPSLLDPSKLNVVTCISNPVRFASRYALYKRFAAEMAAAGVKLTTVEAAFGARPHATRDLADQEGLHLQLKTDDELWHKENMLNLGVQRLPADWEYVAWVDADITFLRPDWQEETLEALQHYPIVQMFETAIDEGPTGAAMNTYTGFAKSFVKGLPYGPGAGGSYGPYWHSGFAWAARREAFEALGGLIDFAILGAADHHMALSFIGNAKASLPGDVNLDYAKLVYAFQQRAEDASITGNIGYVPGSIAHHFHGAKKNRNYVGRWDVLVKHNFDPALDISRDSQGLWQLTKRGLRMRNDLRAYFRQRNEDGIDE
jgi:hypothetical protein